jgi:hypothetical protein
MTKKFAFVHDLPDDPDNPNGPTIREANEEKKHNIPIDTLVEVKYNTWFGDGACIKAHARLWVVKHLRDCDGTPLYMLADKTRKSLEEAFGMDFENKQHLFHTINGYCDVLEHGFGEERLLIIERDEAINRGKGALYWDDECCEGIVDDS